MRSMRWPKHQEEPRRHAAVVPLCCPTTTQLPTALKLQSTICVSATCGIHFVSRWKWARLPRPEGAGARSERQGLWQAQLQASFCFSYLETVSRRRRGHNEMRSAARELRNNLAS